MFFKVTKHRILDLGSTISGCVIFISKFRKLLEPCFVCKSDTYFTVTIPDTTSSKVILPSTLQSH